MTRDQEKILKAAYILAHYFETWPDVMHKAGYRAAELCEAVREAQKNREKKRI